VKLWRGQMRVVKQGQGCASDDARRSEGLRRRRRPLRLRPATPDVDDPAPAMAPAGAPLATAARSDEGTRQEAPRKREAWPGRAGEKSCASLCFGGATPARARVLFHASACPRSRSVSTRRARPFFPLSLSCAARFPARKPRVSHPPKRVFHPFRTD